ncbi:MAG TPA: succinate dehydrogenase, cytochrome b556 subunit [Steroidobacteraceae bacterium]|nr:succinate dehydrogenase, cytochrome b556 subunit [Steroidobacteraceae bacterium]
MRARPTSPHTTIYTFRTMAFSLAHRVTGIVLAFGLVVLAYWLMAAAGGEDSYGAALAVLSFRVCKLLLWVLLAAFLYHLVSGLRHLSWDLVLGMEKRQTRVSSVLVVLLVLALLGLFTWLLFFRTVAP